MADEKKDLQPIIIKKKKVHGGHHGGAWKVAYADFVTAMMAFFLVMWLVAQAPEVKESVAGYFNNPTGFMKGGQASVLKGSGASVVDMKRKPPNRKQAEEVVKKELMKAAEHIKERLAGLPDFNNLKQNIEIQMTEEGLRIQLIESNDAKQTTFYRLGSRELNPRGKAILTSISRELKQLENKIVIEGHTDSRTYVYENKYSNWELSADRANSARKLMEDEGISTQQIEAVRGYADRRLRIEDMPIDPRNRRISIIVLNDYSENRYKELKAGEWKLKADNPTAH
ncbi:MAG: OmpA family protein [candidate division Zixibacteria bacterium]|nr:OmpA family protein [candidate division Zixibacteria bacterium]